MFLATTSLSEFWAPAPEPLLFLGPWCRRHDRRQEWAGRGEMLPSPWEDRKKFHAAAEYLDRQMEWILPPLAECLNIHLDHSGNSRYWRILIGTWLMHSLHATYDRYVHLSSAMESHPGLNTFLLDRSWFRTPRDAEDALDRWTTDDLYNLQTFSQLLDGMGHSFPPRIPQREAEAPASNGHSPAGSLKRGVREALRWAETAVLKAAESRTDTALVDIYCPTSVTWGLTWESGFKAAPLRIPAKEEAPGEAAIQDPRRAALSTLPAQDEFMRLWVRSLPENFPTQYLEGFRFAQQRAVRRLRRAPRAMVSSTGWHLAEPAKFFAAELSQRGGRLIALQHGSGYGLLRSMPMEQHERRISDTFLGWGDAPGLQLAALRGRGRSRSVAKSRRLLFVATSNPRYPYRFYSAPQAHELEKYFDWQARFMQELSAPVRDRLAVRLYPYDYGHCLRQRLQQRFPGLRWDGKRTFAASAAESGLIIVDHPGTSMLTALAGNFPTLLFWDPGLWEFRPEAIPHLEKLRQAGIFHNDPVSAARKLEEILSAGSEDWWNSPEIQAARAEFIGRYAPVSGDWKRRWCEKVASS